MRVSDGGCGVALLALGRSEVHQRRQAAGTAWPRLANEIEEALSVSISKHGARLFRLFVKCHP